MAHVIAITLGSPGPVGAAPLGIFYGAGSPVAQTFDARHANPTNAQFGSLYIDHATPALWFEAATGWVQVTIP